MTVFDTTGRRDNAIDGVAILVIFLVCLVGGLICAFGCDSIQGELPLDCLTGPEPPYCERLDVIPPLCLPAEWVTGEWPSLGHHIEDEVCWCPPMAQDCWQYNLEGRPFIDIDLRDVAVAQRMGRITPKRLREDTLR